MTSGWKTTSFIWGNCTDLKQFPSQCSHFSKLSEVDFILQSKDVNVWIRFSDATNKLSTRTMGTQRGISRQLATWKTAVTGLCKEYEMTPHEYSNTYCPGGNKGFKARHKELCISCTTTDSREILNWINMDGIHMESSYYLRADESRKPLGTLGKHFI